MKALTLTQPWASLVAIGAKRIETRGWMTSYRGALAIHASKGFPGHAKDLCTSRRVCEAFGWPVAPNPLTQEWLDDSARRIKALPLGCIVATCRLMACVRTEDLLSKSAYASDMTEQEELFGNYEPRRWGWMLTDIKPLREPILAKGALSLWDWIPDGDRPDTLPAQDSGDASPTKKE